MLNVSGCGQWSVDMDASECDFIQYCTSNTYKLNTKSNEPSNEMSSNEFCTCGSRENKHKRQHKLLMIINIASIDTM